MAARLDRGRTHTVRVFSGGHRVGRRGCRSATSGGVRPTYHPQRDALDPESKASTASDLTWLTSGISDGSGCDLEVCRGIRSGGAH